MEKIKIGLVGTSQLSFPGDKETAFKRCADGLMAKKDSIGIGYELVVYPTTVITGDDGRAAVKFMEDAGVDFLMVQHTSYTGGAVAPIFAKIKNARVGFWAIPEGVSSGVVPFNSFCSINMHMGIVAHYCKDYGIKVKWFYGDVEDAAFLRRFEVTVRAITAIKNVCRSKVALVGGIAPYFNDLYDDERNFLRRFEGLYYNRLHEYSEIKDLALSFTEEEVAPVIAKMLGDAKGISTLSNKYVTVSDEVKARLDINARIYMAYRRFIDENKYDAIAVSCWPKFQDDFHFSVCSVVGQLNDEGTVMACEGDVLSAVSMLVLKYIAGGDPTMLMDMSAFDEADNSVQLWHCGPAAAHFCKNSGYCLSGNCSGAAHIPGCGLTAVTGITRDMVFDENPATIFRLSGECDRMLCFNGDFIDPTKPSLAGSRGWLGNIKLQGEATTALDLVNTILSSGFQHHFPVVLGNWAEEVEEVAAWLGIKSIEKIPYKNYLQQ